MAGVSGIFAFRAPLRTTATPVTGVLAEVGDVGGAGLVDAQGVVQQKPHHGRSAERLGAEPSLAAADDASARA